MLNSFGSIFAFAIALEAQMRDYYQAIGAAERAKDADKRRQNLERVRRENVTEIKLEPIDGLDEANYALSLDGAEAQRNAEGLVLRFYRDVAPKINVREAQRALERCAKQYEAYLT